MGGMGNQLFQYATGRAVSFSNKRELKMDVDGYENMHISDTPRQYALNIFNIQENFADKNEIEKLQGNIDGAVAKILQKIGLTKKHSSFIIEQHFNFYSELLNVGDNSYLQGYWQTEKYFKGTEDVIRKEFTLKDEFSIEEKKITKEIKNSNAISLHIRRGDYVASATANKFHGTSSLEYYALAVKHISEKIENPFFYIFSDDIDWVKENLKINFPIKYVSGDTLKDYEELMLMSYCKHNIIANSSFSWWGAWLNNNPEKIVIAPKQWFADKSVNTSDIIPETWIKL